MGNFNKASRADTQRQLLTFVYLKQRQTKTGAYWAEGGQEWGVF